MYLKTDDIFNKIILYFHQYKCLKLSHFSIIWVHEFFCVSLCIIYMYVEMLMCTRGFVKLVTITYAQQCLLWNSTWVNGLHFVGLLKLLTDWMFYSVPDIKVVNWLNVLFSSWYILFLLGEDQRLLGHIADSRPVAKTALD